jgi:hypothetical protein
LSEIQAAAASATASIGIRQGFDGAGYLYTKMR